MTKNCKNQGIGTGIGLLGLRLFLAWEFFESGKEKWNGENWFMEVQDSFPFPFNIIPADISWNLAMGAEILLPLFLIFGFLTRFSALSLAILTSVAWYTVHADAGYNVCDNGYKMALIYLITLLPLITQGAGTLSLDSLIKKVNSTKDWLKFL
ncbi:TPA: DoxX family protein [Pasteurella multocida]|nr:DoxX family protein [Pasteurella multocida]